MVLATVGATLLHVLILGDVPAWAGSELSGPPDSDGHYLHCSYNVTGTSGTVTFYWSCQTSGPVGVSGQAFTGYWYDGSNNAINTNFIGGTYSVAANAGGKFRVSKVVTLGAGGLNVANTQAGLASLGACGAYVNGAARTRVQCGVDTVAVGSSYPAYPPDYWPGGGAGGGTLVACWTVDPEAPANGDTVILSAFCSSGDPETWAWTVTAPTGGTNHSGSSASLAFVVDAEGSWAVTLVVTAGATSATHSGSFTVGDQGGCSIWSLFTCLTDLFVPETSLSDRYDELQGSVGESWPVGPATWAIDELIDTVTEFQTGISSGPDPLSDYRALQEFCTGDGDFGVNLDLDGDPETDDVRVNVIPDSCGGSETFEEGSVAETMWDVVHTTFRVMFTLSLVFWTVRFVRRRALGLMGGSD